MQNHSSIFGRTGEPRRPVGVWAYLSVALLILLSAGCFTIYHVRPLSIPDASLMETVPQFSAVVCLGMDRNYREYVSHDSGHWAADRQRYDIGPSLTLLTEHYFDRAFDRVVVVNDKTSADAYPGCAYLVTPRVAMFDNTVAALPLQTQTFEVTLEATFRSLDASGLELRVRGSGYDERVLDPGLESEALIGRRLSLVLQQALLEMLTSLRPQLTTEYQTDDLHPL